MTPRRSFIVLGIAGALVIALFAIGATHDGDGGPGGGCAADQRDAWRARLFGGSPVEPGQLRGCTTRLAPFVFSGSCDLQIAAAAPRSRALTITAGDAILFSLDTDADGRTLTTHDTLAAGQQRQVFVGTNGQTLRLVCPTSTCHAQLSTP
jgi:hypothetical protein